MAMKKTSAYYDMATITAIKSIIVQAPRRGLYFKTFYSSNFCRIKKLDCLPLLVTTTLV